jgi:hypothetical protein
MKLQAWFFTVLFTVITATPLPSEARPWSIELEGGYGRADETLHSPIGSINYDAFGFFSGSLGVSTNGPAGLRVGTRLGWTRRGHQQEQTTVYHPDGDGTYLDAWRDYVDLATAISYQWTTGPLFLSGGIGPRLSFLVHEGDYSLGSSPNYDSNSPIIGFDPELKAGFGILRLTARYLWDTMPSFEIKRDGPDVETRDKIFTLGAGLEISL